MSGPAPGVTITLPPTLQPILDSLVGTTPDEKIAQLLLGEISRNLAACEHERLQLEVKYGLEYAEFREKLETGALGDEYDYELEIDAMRWNDLIAEKQHWLQQLRLARELIQ
jgi:hypothetical protein